MSKETGLDIINAIKDNMRYYKVEAATSEDFYKKANEIIEKNIKSSEKPLKILYKYPYIIHIYDSNKNKELFEKFCKINSNIAETFAEQDLQNKIFEFLIKNDSKKINKKTYGELLKFLNQIPLFTVTMVSMVNGLNIQKEETLGNFRLRKIAYKDLNKVYGKNSIYKDIVDEHRKYRNVSKKEDYTFLEYHNTKIRIADDGNILSPSNHINKLADIYREKFNILSLFLYFLCPRLYNDKECCLNISINNIFPASENIIHIYDNLKNPNYNKGGQFISSDSFSASLRKDKFGHGILKDKQDEELLSLIDKNKIGLEKNIYQAIVWAGRSTQITNLDEAFLLLFMSLEALCSEKDINDFVAYYLGTDLQDRLRYKNLIKDMHEKRSLIVHQNSFANTVNFDDYMKLFNIVRKIVYKMHKELPKISTLENLRKHIETIKYS